MVRPEIVSVVGLFSLMGCSKARKMHNVRALKQIGNNPTRIQVPDARMLSIRLDVKLFGAMLAHGKAGRKALEVIRGDS